MTRDDFYMDVDHDMESDGCNMKKWYVMYQRMPEGVQDRFVGHIGWSPYGDGPPQSIVNEWIDNYIEQHSTGINL